MAVDETQLGAAGLDGAEPPSAASAASARLQALLRSVNREIARHAGSSATAAFVCECLDRSCVEAVEVPLKVFAVVTAAGRFFLVRAGHNEELTERVVRREARYVVVERVA
ncbi:MAG: hypothetical protein HOQ03_09520 [Thermoleophilia bacterium]|nr:hypothetical protein [Thermoleophilia bacterium]